MQHLSKNELTALLEAARNHGDERAYLLMLITFSHGLRATETINLTKRNFRDGYLRVKRLKGSLQTTQPLVSHPDPLFDEKTAVERYIAALGPNQKLFDITRFGFDYLIKRYGQMAGIPASKCHAHVLKHTTAMVAIAGGIENARQYLGHKSIASTGQYLRVNDDQASAAFATALKA